MALAGPETDASAAPGSSAAAKSSNRVGVLLAGVRPSSDAMLPRTVRRDGVGVDALALDQLARREEVLERPARSTSTFVRASARSRCSRA